MLHSETVLVIQRGKIKKPWLTECSFPTDNIMFCHPRCYNQTKKHGCLSLALMTPQRMDHVSTVSPFILSWGGRCRFEKGSRNGLRCDQFVNSQAAIWRKLTAAKNVHFGTWLNVFSVYSNSFTSHSPSQDKEPEAFWWPIKLYSV